MGTIKRATCASGAWLIKRVMQMARPIKRGGIRRQFFEGYLLIAKQRGQSLSAIVLDLPAWVSLIGRYRQTPNHSRYYVQTLDQGRDSYLPGTLSLPLTAQTNPELTAGTFESVGLPFLGNADSFIATRYWGIAQPFNGVGGSHTFSLVGVSESRWPMTYASPDDQFVWRVCVVAPTSVRFINGSPEPSNPSSIPAKWTLDIGESALAPVGAKAITRLLDAPQAEFELNWEAAQYPWIATNRPEGFTDDQGNYGYRLTVAAQVVYESAGPYYWFGREDRSGVIDPTSGAWSELATGFRREGGVPSGARGLWAADVEVINGEARITGSYKVFDRSAQRSPMLRNRTLDQGYEGQWYLNNIVYRSPISSITDADGVKTTICISSTFLNRTQDSYDSENGSAQEFDGSLFLDMHWMSGGQVQSQNLITTELKRGVFHADRVAPPYYGANSAWDLGDADEGRFTIGADTDGKTIVFPVFSGFEPGQLPLLRVYTATKDSFALAYSGVPGFAMCMPCGTGEQAIFNYGVVDSDAEPATYGRWITMPAGYDQVTYIGNGRFAFYVSSQINEPEDDNYFFSPAGNIAVAVFDINKATVGLLGVIDPQLSSNGFGSDGPISEQDAFDYVNERAYTVPVFANPPKLGRIECVRPEGDGYDASNPSTQGHPATLIASKGFGQPGLNLSQFDNSDITQGTTWISYDSGATWAVMLDYGSPAGTIHCGNIAQARSEPVVRV